MRDAGAMGAIQSIRNLRGKFQSLLQRQRALGQTIGERLAVDQFHHHIAGPDIEQCADVRMIQRSNGAGFAFEAGAEVFALRDVIRQDFDGDGAVQPGVAGFIDLTHAARAEGREDFVRAELLSRGDGHAGARISLPRVGRKCGMMKGNELGGQHFQHRSGDPRAHHPGRRGYAGPEVARYLLSMRLTQDDEERVNELSAKARVGSLSAAEEQELDSYLHVGFLLGVLRAKARGLLQLEPGPHRQ